MFGNRLFPLSAVLLASALLLQGCRVPADDKLPLVHAHRGGAALYPENTIVAMTHSAASGVPVMELDLQVTLDSQVVVAHDACLAPSRTLGPDGTLLADGPAMEYRIYGMSYDSLRRYDVGTVPDPAFPRRRSVKACVPLVTDLIGCVEQTVRNHRLPSVGYNVEIKSSPSSDGVYTPGYRAYADLCMRALLSCRLGDRLLVQSFDPRVLDYLHTAYPGVRLSYLVEDSTLSFDRQLALLSFVPQVYSPPKPYAHRLGFRPGAFAGYAGGSLDGGRQGRDAATETPRCRCRHYELPGQCDVLAGLSGRGCRCRRLPGLLSPSRTLASRPGAGLSAGQEAAGWQDGKPGYEETGKGCRWSASFPVSFSLPSCRRRDVTCAGRVPLRWRDSVRCRGPSGRTTVCDVCLPASSRLSLCYNPFC